MPSVKDVNTINALVSPLGDGDICRINGIDYQVEGTMRGWAIRNMADDRIVSVEMVSQIDLCRAMIEIESMSLNVAHRGDESLNIYEA